MDQYERGSELVKVPKLNGSENYISWRRSARTMLEWHDLDAYLIENDPMGNTATTAARRAVEAVAAADSQENNAQLRALAVAAEAAARSGSSRCNTRSRTGKKI